MTHAVLITPSTVGAIAVIRVQGKNARDIVRAVSGVEVPPGAVRRARFAHAGQPIDDGLVVGAGEDDLELHAHGGTAVVDALFTALAAAGARRISPEDVPAQTLEDEVAAALPAATTETGVRLLANQPAVMRAWVERVARADAVWRLESEIQWVLDRSAALRRLLAPARVAIVGPPNAGKSTLANALLGRPVAITSDVPGTTRDWVDAEAVLAAGRVHAPVTLVDTAGVRETPDAIEEEAIRRTHGQMARADAAIVVVDATAPDLAVLKQLSEGLPFVIAVNKTDVMPIDKIILSVGPLAVGISAKDGVNLDRLSAAVLGQLDVADVREDEVFAFRDRHRMVLLEASRCRGLDEARQHLRRLVDGPLPQ